MRLVSLQYSEMLSLHSLVQNAIIVIDDDSIVVWLRFECVLIDPVLKECLESVTFVLMLVSFSTIS